MVKAWKGPGGSGWVRRWVGTARMAVGVTVLAAVAGLGSAAALAAGQRRNAEGQLDRRTAAVTDVVAGEAGRYSDTLRTVAAAVGAFENLTAVKFAQVVGPLSDMGLAGASSIVFLVPALDADVPATQALWRSRGVPDLVLRPAPFGREHLLTLSVSGRPLSPAAGQAGAVAVFHDITGRKAAEAQLAETVAQLRERESELHAFAAVVAHDLKSPLQSIGGYAALLAESLTSDLDVAEMRFTLDRIRAGVERMRRLIEDLLTYATARDGTLARTTVDLQDLVDDVVTERTSHLRATGTDPATGQPVLFPDIYTGPLPVVDADPVLIRQLLDNLIGNALKYTLPGQPARIDIAAHPDRDGWARIEIADRGVGIPAADHPHVFDTFHRSTAHRRYSGHGLGLAICKKIVERHSGTIHATDNPGGGTRIILTLPTGTATADPPAVGRTGDARDTSSSVAGRPSPSG